MRRAAAAACIMALGGCGFVGDARGSAEATDASRPPPSSVPDSLPPETLPDRPPPETIARVEQGPADFGPADSGPSVPDLSNPDAVGTGVNGLSPEPSGSDFFGMYLFVPLAPDYTEACRASAAVDEASRNLFGTRDAAVARKALRPLEEAVAWALATMPPDYRADSEVIAARWRAVLAELNAASTPEGFLAVLERNSVDRVMAVPEGLRASVWWATMCDKV